MPQPLHDQKVTVWCGFTVDFILDPYFFEEVQNDQIQSTTVNGPRYHAMLESVVLPALRQRVAMEQLAVSLVSCKLTTEISCLDGVSGTVSNLK